MAVSQAEVTDHPANSRNRPDIFLVGCTLIKAITHTRKLFRADTYWVSCILLFIANSEEAMNTGTQVSHASCFYHEVTSCHTLYITAEEWTVYYSFQFWVRCLRSKYSLYCNLYQTIWIKSAQVQTVLRGPGWFGTLWMFYSTRCANSHSSFFFQFIATFSFSVLISTFLPY